MYGASLVAKDYAVNEVSNRYETEWDVTTNGSSTLYDGEYTDKNNVTKDAMGGKAEGGASNRYVKLTFGSPIVDYASISGNIVLQAGNNDNSATYFKALDQSDNEIFAIRMTGNNTTNVALTYTGNSDGTNIMTVAKYADSSLGNGSSTYGYTGWVAYSAYLDFVSHKGLVSIGSNSYEIDLMESSTSIKGYYLQSGRGYGAVLLAKDYVAYKAPAPAGAVTIKYVDTEETEIALSTTPSVLGKFDGETLNYTYSKYIANGGDLYQMTASKTNASVTLTGEAQEVKVEYDKTKEGTFYFYEFDGGYITRADAESNGSASSSAVTVTVPETGVYRVTANCYASAQYRQATIKVGETILADAVQTDIWAGGTNVTTALTLLNQDDVITVSMSDSKSGIDYVLLEKVTAISGTIAESGWSSLATPYGLDFTTATGLTNAFVVTNITKDAVELTSINEIPANQGVVLKGESGAEYSIPIKSDAAYSGTNKLQAAVTATPVTANEAYILQGGLFHLVNAASTVPAGKAYLLATDVPNEARSLSFLIDDESTSISTVTRELQSGEFYNLQGQRISSPKQGLYIVNGKKVVIK